MRVARDGEALISLWAMAPAAAPSPGPASPKPTIPRSNPSVAGREQRELRGEGEREEQPFVARGVAPKRLEPELGAQAKLEGRPARRVAHDDREDRNMAANAK